MIRFVGATTVTSGDRHRITTWILLAARLASVRAPQGRRMMALDPLSSEHAVLGSAGKASVFGTEASDVRRPCLYDDTEQACATVGYQSGVARLGAAVAAVGRSGQPY